MSIQKLVFTTLSIICTMVVLKSEAGDKPTSKHDMCSKAIAMWTEQFENYKLDSINSAHESRDKSYLHCVARLVKTGEYANAPIYLKFTHDRDRSVITAREL